MDVLLSDDITERGDCAYGANDGATIVACERDVLHPLTTLYGLGEAQVEVDPADSVEVEILEIPPTDEALRVDFTVSSRDQTGAA